MIENACAFPDGFLTLFEGQRKDLLRQLWSERMLPLRLGSKGLCIPGLAWTGQLALEGRTPLEVSRGPTSFRSRAGGGSTLFPG